MNLFTFIAEHQAAISNQLLLVLTFTSLYLAAIYLFAQRIKARWLIAAYLLGILATIALGPIFSIRFEGTLFIFLACLRLLAGKMDRPDWLNLLSYSVLVSLSLAFRQLVGTSLVYESLICLSFLYLLWASSRGDWLLTKKTNGITLLLELILLVAAIALAYLKPRYQALGQLTGALAGLAVLLTTFLLNKQLGLWQAQSQMDEQKQLFKLEENYYESLLAREEETKKFRHDARQHLVTMQALAHSGNYAELTSYLDDLTQDASFSQKLIDTGNLTVNAILADLAARYPGVNFAWTGVIPRLTIKPVDLTIIFANLLKNAAQAASSAGNHQVTATVRFAGRAMVLNVVNQTKDEVDTSSDFEGIGLTNVRRCLAAYQGHLTLECTDGTFSAEVIIPEAMAEA